jgi:hypothetical protein
MCATSTNILVAIVMNVIFVWFVVVNPLRKWISWMSSCMTCDQALDDLGRSVMEYIFACELWYDQEYEKALDDLWVALDALDEEDDDD